MQTLERRFVANPLGEQPKVEVYSAIADTFAGRVHVEWDAAAPVTPFGQLPFFIDYLKQAGLFEAWVADCPVLLTSPNAPRKRDLLGRDNEYWPTCADEFWPTLGVFDLLSRA